MIIFKTHNSHIAISNTEYTLYLEDGKWPNGDNAEIFVIQTPAKKYSLLGIDSGNMDGLEIMDKVTEYIIKHFFDPIILIDFDEITESTSASDTIIAQLSVSSN